jgi:TolB-like protein
MAEERVQRRLAAILAADVVGYSRLMESDEAGTLAALKARRKSVLEPLVARHQGRVFKVTGDGVLVEFGSAVNAVQCAVDLQQSMAAANSDQPEERHIVLRIGINLGDVMVDGSDLYGDGVNIAARLEGLAEPGGILVSATAHDHVGTKVRVGFEELGTQPLKNIAQPVRVYRVTGTPAVAAAAPKPASNKASLAVLAFTNMSGDPEQEYFVDGLSEDLITDLSKVHGLFVISRHSSFAYKGKSVDIRSIAKDLGVRFVVEGSVRRAAARVRINVQLIDASDGTHVWADRFDRELADIFTVQDEVVGRIVSALSGVLPSAARPIARQRATNLEAYDLFVRGRVLVKQSAESNRAARPLLERSIELDPGFADAHAWLAMNHLGGWAYWGEPAEPHCSLALAAAKRAVSLDPENAGAHAILGEVLVFVGEPDAAAAELARALEIDPNHADAWVILGEVKTYEGSAVEAIDHARKAFRLNPYPPGWYYWYLGFMEYAAGRYAAAAETLRHEAIPSGSRRILAASLAQLGRVDEARLEAARFLAAYPRFSIKQWANRQPFRRETDRQHFADGYRRAGLPT